MSRILFDIEADGLLGTITKIHCIEAVDVDTKQWYSYGPNQIQEALTLLFQADTLIGHNIQGYDIPAIKKLFPLWQWGGQVRDTLVMSRLQHVHDMMKHGLEAWGERLNFAKGDYGKEPDAWASWSQPMQDYCKQDVRLNLKIWELLDKENFPDTSIDLEHQFAKVLDWQMKCGVPFKVDEAKELAQELHTTYDRMLGELKEGIPPFVKEVPFTPKVNRPTLGYIKGVPTVKRTETPFNPGSRTQVVKLLKEKYNWKPKEFTDIGNPKVSGDVLRSLEYPEAKPLADFYDVKKLMGQVSTGKAAWLTKVTSDGKIHGFINHNGAITGRCTHSSPNLGQVPSVGGFKGATCRSLFYAPAGYKMVGCDASGLELRNLAHYMALWDDGKYAKIILEGDIHTENQNAAGLPTRDLAKRFIYAHNYGCGDKLLGDIVLPKASESKQKAVGAEMRWKFTKRIPALGKLIDMVKSTARSRGYLIGLDGRRLYVHSDHVALNVLLQGAGAVLMKKWWVMVWEQVAREKLDAYPCLHVHDEGQAIVSEDHAERYAQITEECMIATGEFYNYRIRLDGESKIGMNWKETH